MTTPLELDTYALDQSLAPQPCDCPRVMLQWAEPAGPGMVTVEGGEVPAPAGMSGPGWILQVGAHRAAVGGGGGGDVAWSDVTGKPTAFPPEAHTHTIAQVTNLQAALNGKAATTHTHTMAQVTGLQAVLTAGPVALSGATGYPTTDWAYTSRGGLIVMEGFVERAAGATFTSSFVQIGTLPVAARPAGAQLRYFATAADGAGVATGHVSISASGAVSVRAATGSTRVFFTGITYPAA